MALLVDDDEKCLMLEYGCSDDVKRQKWDDTMDREKLPYVATVGGSDVVDGSDAQLESADFGLLNVIVLSTMNRSLGIALMRM